MTSQKGMQKSLILLLIYFADFNIVNSRPAFQLEDNGGELLGVSDTRCYEFPHFRYDKPFYENDNDDYLDTGGQIIESNRYSSMVPYANVGAGWGR